VRSQAEPGNEKNEKTVRSQAEAWNEKKMKTRRRQEERRSLEDRTFPGRAWEREETLDAFRYS
jgi:hypothetical protein